MNLRKSEILFNIFITIVGIFVVIMVGVMFYSLYDTFLVPHTYIKLRADKWKCTKTEFYMVGRVLSSQCIEYSKK